MLTTLPWSPSCTDSNS